MLPFRDPNKETQRREIDLLEYWRIILKRKWVGISFASLVVILAALMTFTTTPLYKASANIIIEEQGSNMLSIQEMFSSSYPRYDYMNQYFNTQLRVLKSRTLAERVARRMDLGRRPEIIEARKGKKGVIQTVKDYMVYIISLKFVKKMLGGEKKEVAQPPEPSYRPDPYSRLAFIVLGGLDIEPVEETRVVKVSYISPYPVLCADIVNTIVDEFINYSIETRYEATQQAYEFLNSQIEQLREELAARERELQKYGEEKKIFFLNEKESTVVSKFAELNNAYTQAQIDRIGKEASYRELKALKVDALPPYVDNPVIQSLREEYMRLKSEYREKSKIFKSDYPEMVKLQAKIEGLREELEKELRKAVEAAEADYRSALNKEKSLEVLLDSQREDVIMTNSNAILYKSLQIEVENKRALLNSLVAKQNETLVSARLSGLKTSNIRVIDKALVPKKPVAPNKKRNMMWALFLGIFGGLGIIFLVDYLDNTIKGPEEVERLTGLPSLGIIPFYIPNGGRRKGPYGKYYYSGYYYGGYRNGGKYYDGDGYRSKRGYRGYYRGSNLAPQTKHIELINYFYPKFFIAEDYRTVRTSLLLSQGDRKPRVITFLSSMPKEGKTSNVVNTAVSFSQLNIKVLIIDADLRKPRVHKIFKLKNKVGLSNYLIGTGTIDEVVQKTAVENLFIIPCGPKPPNPAELLNSHRMKDLVREAREKFSVVLIDTPPLMAVIDGVVVSTLADGAVYIIQAGKTPRKPFLRCVEKLKNAKIHIFGVLYNEAKLERRSSYYNAYYQYHYYYASDEEEHGGRGAGGGMARVGGRAGGGIVRAEGGGREGGVRGGREIRRGRTGESRSGWTGNGRSVRQRDEWGDGRRIRRDFNREDKGGIRGNSDRSYGERHRERDWPEYSQDFEHGDGGRYMPPPYPPEGYDFYPPRKKKFRIRIFR
ncbi:MAG: GumC family protein [Candidatus Aminicenantales bacterium]